jgi:hypothetical protein
MGIQYFVHQSSPAALMLSHTVLSCMFVAGLKFVLLSNTEDGSDIFFRKVVPL